jgi:hypothetical protein
VKSSRVAIPFPNGQAGPGQSPEDFAERVVRRFLHVCENPRTRDAMLRFVRGSLSGGWTSRFFYRNLNRMVLRPLAGPAGLHASTLRLQLVTAQLAGLAMMRYVVKLEPLASMSVDELVVVFAPSVRGALHAQPAGPAYAWAEERSYPAVDWAGADLRRQVRMTGRLAP